MVISSFVGTHKVSCLKWQAVLFGNSTCLGSSHVCFVASILLHPPNASNNFMIAQKCLL
eukprot:UN01036